MNTSRILKGVALAGLLAAASTTLFAAGDRCNYGPRGHGGDGPWAAVYHLDKLSDEQRTQLDALRDKQREEREKSRSEHQALRDAIDKATDAKTLQPLADQEGKFVSQRIMKRLEWQNEVDKILTPEQRTQLQEMKQKWRDEHRERREFRDREPRD